MISLGLAAFCIIQTQTAEEAEVCAKTKKKTCNYNYELLLKMRVNEKSKYQPTPLGEIAPGRPMPCPDHEQVAPVNPPKDYPGGPGRICAAPST